MPQSAPPRAGLRAGGGMMLLLLLLLPLGTFACIPMKTIDRGIPAVPGGCKLGAVKQISQADLDVRYCTGANPAMPAGCPSGQGCVAPTITATSVTCDDPAASTFAWQLPDGGVNAGPVSDASCSNEMWTLNGVVPDPTTYPYINTCWFP
ncbi:hypothetical protein PRIPAC_86368 [Pristionchus pacificus]|uniref:Uncharacterized protein n=1 Tax=Pristionchus pacificus TaxID=54126 RepID=A0A2A6BRY5_PRIPA|nr:hypothetical protein PRIPAC_86368 [Pristionchus pacificus]|eukprot:PDM68655.1 hypothetical protein PRIPAC_46957 [Pristionchus pacificus]